MERNLLEVKSRLAHLNINLKLEVIEMRACFSCPVCGCDKGAKGKLFYSANAIAYHIVGKILRSSSDSEHESWMRKINPDINFKLSMDELADEIMDLVCVAIKFKPLTLVHKIENVLHSYVRLRLQEKFGTDEKDWWVKGVPSKIREECAKLREKDPSRSHAYSYIYFIDYKSILDKNWSLFEKDFLRLNKFIKTKKDFLELFVKLNNIRNCYAHPIRAPRDYSHQYKEDFTFAIKMVFDIEIFCDEKIFDDEQ